MSFFEFPHTRTYDSDLGWLIGAMKQLITDTETFIKTNTIKFADPIEWDITKNYESNTIVLDSEGAGYISRQPVPSGIPINNTEYWTRIFSFQQLVIAVEELRRQIAAADEGESETASGDREIGDLIWLNGVLFRATTEIAIGTRYIESSNVEHVTIEYLLNELDEKIDTEISTRIASDEVLTTLISNLSEALDNEVTARTESDELINNEIDIIKSNYTIFLGDSYGVEGVTERGIPWPIRCAGYLGLSENEYINNSQGSVGFTTTTNYLTLLENMSVPDPDKVARIVVCGGGNDDQTPSDILPAIRDFMSYVKTNYPNAKVYIGFIYNSKLLANKNIIRTMLTYYTLCAQYGAIYLNGVENVLHSYTSYFSDDNHPNAAGNSQLGLFIANAIISGACDVYRIYRYNAMSVNTDIVNTISNSNFIYEEQRNDRVIMACDGTNILLKNETVIANATILNIGSINPLYILPDGKFTSIHTYASVVNYTDDGTETLVIPVSVVYASNGNVNLVFRGSAPRAIRIVISSGSISTLPSTMC